MLFYVHGLDLLDLSRWKIKIVWFKIYVLYGLEITLFASVARFNKDEWKPNGVDENLKVNNSKHTNNMNVDNKDSRNPYASLVEKGKIAEKNLETKKNNPKQMVIEGKYPLKVNDASCVVLCKVKDVILNLITNIHKVCKKKGYGIVEINYMGGL